jgi:recombination protein RecA
MGGNVTALDELIAKTNKKAGGTLIVRGSDLKDTTIPRITTGSLAFDLMLGGGWPLNCWNEVIGNESNGKTVMVLKTIAACQAQNPEHETLWIASEDFVPDWAETLGVNLDKVAVASTKVMEEAYQLVIDAIDGRAVDAVVIDSYPALIPTVEDEKTMHEMSVGLGARLTGQFMRKSNKAQRRSLDEEDRPCLGIIINQWREKIGVMYGDPRTTPGGKAKNFSYFTRVEVTRDDWVERGNSKVGISIKAKTIKNKTAPPQRTGLVDFYFQDSSPFHQGEYDAVKEVSSIAISLEVVSRRGAMYHFGEQKWRGKEEFLDALRQDLDLQRDIADQVKRMVIPNG